MKTLRVGLCFLDDDNNVIVKRTIEANWSMDWQEILKKENKVHMIDEVASILTEITKIQLHETLIKSMLQEYEKKLGEDT